MGRSGSGFPHKGNHPSEDADDQREGARIEKPLRPHEVVQLESYAHHKADKAE